MIRSLLCALILLTVAASGQECTQSFQVSVIDQKSGSFISGLTSTAFSARSGKTSLVLVDLEPVRTRRILVLFDESGSMSETPLHSLSRQGPALRNIKQTLAEVLGKLPPGVSVEYGLFNNKAVFGERFLHDSDELQKSMEEVRSRFGKIGVGETALYDALQEGLTRFQTFQPGDSILLVTDGGDNHSKMVEKKLRNAVQAAGVRLLTILFYSDEPLRPEFNAVPDFLDLVASTGGSSINVNTSSNSWIDKKAIAANTQAIRSFWYSRVLSGYIARVQVPGALKQREKWMLFVNKDANPALQNLLAVYPNHLNACALTAAPR